MSNALSRTIEAFVRDAESRALVGDRYRQRVHLMPPTGWLNDPNGLCQLGGEFHAFFQYGPFDVNGGLKIWGHYVSDDLVSWEYVGAPLLADQPFDCHGVYSGSAIVEGGRMSVLYTGNVKTEGVDPDHVDDGREANTVLAESTDGGRTFGPKRLVMTNADYPSDCTCHVRDPKVWRDGGSYLMVQGCRRRAAEGTAPRPSAYCSLHGERAGIDVGEVLVFRSRDLRHWRLARRFSTTRRFGFMWECPDYFELPVVDVPESSVRVLSVSPQGLEGGDWDRRNIYQSGYFLLDNRLLAASSPRPESFRLWDAGFDFYAPQTFEAADGRRILIGWMGMPDEPAHKNPTVESGWQHCFTIPRELVAAGGTVRQRPVRELGRYHRRGERAAWSAERHGSVAFDVVVDGVGQSVLVRLADELSITWDERARELVMRFSERGEGSVGAGRGERREPVKQLRNLRLVCDASSVEVFANDGELVMTTRYYPREYSVFVDAPGAEIRLWDLEA